MKTLRPVTLALAATICINVAAETNAPKTYRDTGTVVDATGRPVPGATVDCYQYGARVPGSAAELELAQRIAAGTNGVFELELKPGAAALVARKPGLAPGWKRWTPGLDTPQRLVLTPTAVLAGVVVDEADKPVPNAEVSVEQAYSETSGEGGRSSYDYLDPKLARSCFLVRSDAQGRFRIENFPTNAVADLVAQAPGKAMRRSPREYTGPDSMQCRPGQEGIRLVMEPAGNIEGKIVAEETGQPLPVARLTLQPAGPGVVRLGDREPARSGADGTFRIRDVPAGSYRIQAVFGTNAASEWVAESVPVSVETGQMTRSVQVSATRGGFLEVAVLRKNDLKPLEEVSVSASKENFHGSAASGSNGTALLRLPPGEYQISAYKEGWQRAESSAAVVDARKTNHVDLSLAPRPRITGMVRRPDGQPAARLPVRIVGIHSPDGKSDTDASGKFEMEWNVQRYGRDNFNYCLLVRDAERNLAVAQDVDEETGPLDLRLAPALTFVGRAECDGKPLTNVSATLIFWTGNSGMHLYGLATGTNVPGRFEISAMPPGRRYGVYLSAPGYGQKAIHDLDSAAGAGRVELEPVELKRANLRLAGKVVDADDKPVAGANLSLYGEGQPTANTRTDREGRFSFDRVCEGTARLSANARNSHGSIEAEGGDTNVVLQLGESYSGSSSSKPMKLKGTVTDPGGKPVAGAMVAVFPSGDSRWIKTGTNGAFNLTWTIESWRSTENSTLVVRDLARNLAAAEDLSEETTNLTVELKPAATLAGRVEGPDGTPLTNAQVGVWLLAARSYSQVGEQLAATDARGGFQIKTLPAGPQYLVFAKAKGHGRSQQTVQVDSETNQMELDPFVLRVADQVLSGRVVNAEEKPVSGVQVSLSGEDQPEGSATTDSKGRFKFQVCEGQVRLFASSQSTYANVTAEAGDTNVVVTLGSNSGSGSEAPRRTSLTGQPRPDLTALDLPADAVPAGKPVLVCLFDFEQRPSRRVVRLLAEQHDALRQKGIAVVAIQAAPAEADALKAWKDGSPMPFAVGCVSGKSDKNRWVTAVGSLPWLILSDAQGRVTAEGFAVDELEAKIKVLAK